MNNNIKNILKTILQNVTSWSERSKKSGNIFKLVWRIRNFLLHISGNDLILM